MPALEGRLKYCIFGMAMLYLLYLFWGEAVPSVDSGYINGSLTVFSIIFALWVAMWGLKPENRIQKFLWWSVVDIMYINLELLFFIMLYIVLSAIGLISSSLPLAILFVGISLNIFLLVIYFKVYFRNAYDEEGCFPYDIPIISYLSISSWSNFSSS
jgi:hypothetical protein